MLYSHSLWNTEQCSGVFSRDGAVKADAYHEVFEDYFSSKNAMQACSLSTLLKLSSLSLLT